MKKLLILGANQETIPLVEAAKSIGIYTIVTDHNPAAPAKKFANKSINIDGMDVMSLVDFCRLERVDGVLVGVADRLIEPYQMICEILNLPCYGSAQQCEILTNKEKFNKLCAQYEVLTIPSITLHKNDSLTTLSDLTYPIFIKPVDSNSGKGVSIVYNMQELSEGVKKAFNNSKSDYILLENYMLCKDVLISYTIINGEPILSAMADRYTCKDQDKTSQVCLGAIYSSKFLELYKAVEHPKVVKMLKSIGIKNAILTISAFVQNEKFYHYDPGFRLQGEAPNLHIENITGFDQKKFLLDIALGNVIEEVALAEIDVKKKYAATIWFLLKKGVILTIDGFDFLIKNYPQIFYISKRLSVGDVVTDDMIGTEGQVLARVYVCCDTKEELQTQVSIIQNTIRVIDDNGNNQLLSGFTIEL